MCRMIKVAVGDLSRLPFAFALPYTSSHKERMEKCDKRKLSIQILPSLLISGRFGGEGCLIAGCGVVR